MATCHPYTHTRTHRPITFPPRICSQRPDALAWSGCHGAQPCLSIHNAHAPMCPVSSAPGLLFVLPYVHLAPMCPTSRASGHYVSYLTFYVSYLTCTWPLCVLPHVYLDPMCPTSHAMCPTSCAHGPYVISLTCTWAPMCPITHTFTYGMLHMAVCLSQKKINTNLEFPHHLPIFPFLPLSLTLSLRLSVMAD